MKIRCGRPPPSIFFGSPSPLVILRYKVSGDNDLRLVVLYPVSLITLGLVSALVLASLGLLLDVSGKFDVT